MRVYLQIEKRANSALILFEKNSDTIIIAVGLAVRICGSRPQGPGSTPGLQKPINFLIDFFFLLTITLN